MAKIDSALHLAAAGYRVFPLEPDGKRPLLKGWPDLATTDEATLRAWWAAHPNANIGIATGKGLLVLDCDCKGHRHGLDSLAMLDLMGLPEGVRVRTPTGGVHVYLSTGADIGNSVDGLDDLPGIDVRANGGFVVGPGSTIGGQAYVAL